MTMEILTWLVALPLLGAVTGLRSMLPMAVLCWFAYGGHLPLGGTWAGWAGKLPVAILFTLLALAELVADKLPNTPDRISRAPLLARCMLSGLLGAIVATGLDGPGIEGVILAILGMLVGAYGGYNLRHELVHRLAIKDWRVAITEDLIAIGSAILAMGVVTG